MARKKRPTIQGTDPNYTTNFTSSKDTFAPAMPSPLVIPSPQAIPLEASTPATDGSEAATDTLAPEAASSAVVEAKPAPQIEEPSTPDNPDEGLGATESTEPNSPPVPVAPKAKQTRPRKSPAKETQSAKRPTGLEAAAKRDHSEALSALEEKGYAMRNVLQLAGRRAVARFELKPRFEPKQDVERLPARKGGYYSTKQLPVSILDDLRNTHDPLRLKSDAAMVRGQFEPLFWTCLDEVIAELQKKEA